MFRKNFGSNKIVVITVGSKKKDFESNPKKTDGCLVDVGVQTVSGSQGGGYVRTSQVGRDRSSKDRSG